MKACVVCLALAFSACGFAQVLGEVGTNDFRISFRGGTGDPDFDAYTPAVAYNSVDHEYLVVFGGAVQHALPVCPPNSPIEREIFLRRINAATGALLRTAALQVSQSGPICDDTHVAESPAVAYNATDNEYLVVWRGQDDDGGLADEEFEIFGQRLDATGQHIGTIGFRISFMGGSGDSAFLASNPAVAWNAADNEYLVVWHGDDGSGGLVDDELEVFGRRLNANGSPQGPGAIRISDAGGTGDAAFYAFEPAVTWNETHNQYLVVWWGEDDEGGLVDGEVEIFGQRLDGAGAEIGSNDFRITDMGGTGDTSFSAVGPAVAWSNATAQYLVVWAGSDNEGGAVAFDQEIFGQRLNAAGGEIGANDFRISDAGGTGANAFLAANPAVTWNPTAGAFLVVWAGGDDTGDLVAGEDEVFGQLIDPGGGETGSNDFRISDMGGPGDPDFDARWPAVAANPLDNEYLVVWHGDDNEGGLVDGENEIFGQRLGDVTIFADGFESGQAVVRLR